MHYVIGDVHGCMDELQRLVAKINATDPEAVIFFTGDFIDRGPKVLQVLEWMMQNVSPDGKYRCVLGNHEDEVLKWWYTIKDYWTSDEAEVTDNLPALRYGLDQILKEAGIFTRSYMEQIITFFEEMPLYYDISITASTGKEINYIVAHAYVPHRGQQDDERAAYLWCRDHMWGYNVDDGKILVHGHTPTTDFDFTLRHMTDARPGMVVYGHRAINVDSGCCYFPMHGGYYPCMLSGICLETLEEFYSHTLKERFEEHLKLSNDGIYALDREEAINNTVSEYWEGLRNHGYKPGEEYYYVRELIKAVRGNKKVMY